MVDYIGQSFTPQELKVSCKHKYRICDCGAVHCVGACKFTQVRRHDWSVIAIDGSSIFVFSEPLPDKRAPCFAHGGEPC